MIRMRLLLPSALFALWGGAAAFMHFRQAGPQREYYLEAGRKIAMIQGEHFPPRARLLDAEGTPLAWSERYFDLEWQEPAAPPARLLRSLAEELKMPLEPEETIHGQTWILRRDLTPEELLCAAPVLRKHPALAIRSRLQRIAVHRPDVREKIGETRLENGVLRGISGWEKEYDAVLRGTPGKYEVMLDRRRRWIDNSWKLLSPAVPGKDVQLPFRMEAEQ
ncbi:MAG: hypothetical protein J6S73_01140 [Lentisphaeria bacterium]|nr:hypothetical protein [Lentisphaeria bacterium]